MKPALVKPFLFFVLLGLSLSACDKKETAEPAPTQKYYPVSVTRTASYTSDITRSEFTYNGANQITSEQIFKNEQLQRQILYTYDINGKLTNREYLSETGQLTEQDNITYNQSGLPDRLSHAYVDANRQPLPHHYRLHEFNAEGKISKWTDNKIDGTVINSRTYTYPAPEKVVSPAFDTNGQPINTSEITLDQKLMPFQNTTLNLLPYAGNELKHVMKDLNGQVILEYTNIITYNEAGYPTKIVQENTDGTVKTEVYQYK